MVLMIKNPPANAGDIRDSGSIPGSGRSPGGGHGNPLQYSCLENPVDRGAWWAMVCRATKSRTRLRRLSTYSRSNDYYQTELLSLKSPSHPLRTLLRWNHSAKMYVYHSSHSLSPLVFLDGNSLSNILSSVACFWTLILAKIEHLC